MARPLLAIALLAGCQGVQTRQSVDVLAAQPARCSDALRQAAGAIAFRGDAAWQAHLASLARELRSTLWGWQVDFASGQSVVLAGAGPQPNPGYRIALADRSLPVRDGVLRVVAVVQPPPADRVQAQVISYPCLYLKLTASSFNEVAVDVPAAGR